MALRVETIDKIKGLLIIFVIYGHITYGGYLYDEFSRVKDFIYIFHMPIFLFISGFFFRIIHNRYDLVKLWQFLILPYFVFYLTYLCVLFYLSKYSLSLSFSNELHSFADIFYFLLIEPLASYWYLHSLILFSIFFSVFIYIFNRFGSEYTSLFLSSCSILLAIYYLECLGVKVRVWVFFYLLLGYLTSFFLQAKFFLLLKSKIVFISSIFLLLLILHNYTVIQIIESFVLRAFFSVSLLFVIFKILEKLELKFLIFLGKGSIVFFLLHVYPLNLMKFFKGWILTLDSSGFLFILISLLFTIYFSLSVVLTLDHLRLSKFIFGRDNVFHKMKV